MDLHSSVLPPMFAREYCSIPRSDLLPNQCEIVLVASTTAADVARSISETKRAEISTGMGKMD